MASIHELEVPLTPGVGAAFSPFRIPCAELHVNPWAAGTKGTPSVTIGLASNGAIAGIQMVPQRLTVASNAPSELILGDISAGWLVNIAEGAALSVAVSNISLIYMP